MLEFLILFGIALVLVAFFNPPKPKEKNQNPQDLPTITIHIHTSLYKSQKHSVSKDQTSCRNL
ncbi:hypothetical protein [Helicobacter cholecystus]|uniref:hypothetical protein n=1 Tax=Helicobacter cholecystus TaxID=45498 RepID=UPI0027393EFA|nr:hypothetical protein [Helicobacter cholecystus]